MAKTVQVQIEVERGASRFRVSVRAATVRRALRLVGAGYPDATVRALSSTQTVLSAVSSAGDDPEVDGAGRVGSAA